MQRQCICNKIAGTCDFVNKSIWVRDIVVYSSN
jgi:hypothetical protein